MKPVFIIGSKRSGTTWTMWLLARHPAIVGFFHSDLFAYLKHLETWWQTNPPYAKGIITAIDEEQDEKATNSSGSAQLHLNDLLTIKDLYGYCRSFSTNIINKIVSCKPGARVFLETTPENLERLEFILGVFPDAYILHVVRDPRSVFSSWRNAASTWSDPSSFETNPVEFARRWHLDVTTARKAKDMTSRYKEVQYEALLSDGSVQLEQIYSWLGLPTDESSCRKAVEACKIDKLRKHVSVSNLRGFFRKGVAQGWREEISSSDIRTIEHIVGDLMEELGYEHAFPRSTRKPTKFLLYETTAKVLKWIMSGPIGRRLMKLRVRTRRMVN